MKLLQAIYLSAEGFGLFTMRRMMGSVIVAVADSLALKNASQKPG
jgi:hypothetical protein